ncbi:MAG: arsenosugar biosynthesis radical SAM protein ArsS, partial [Bacillota bacterium]|nr:arsenosugar biosynthesis radical SAM protein ArsS [Bacillota bacterium]
MQEEVKSSFTDRAGEIKSSSINTVQVNLGLHCNLRCSHCHQSASPDSTETMSWKVMEAVIQTAHDFKVKNVDITGGAPELNPNLRSFIESLYRPDLNIILRTNLSALVLPKKTGMAEFFKEKRIKVIASLPCHLEENVNAQRGDNAYVKSIKALKTLNSLGYGKGSGLELNLVYNPGGPFLPARQVELEATYSRELGQQHGITFDRLLTITNMPIGRFKDCLLNKGQLDEYIKLLHSNFNQANLPNLMCRSQISVGWDGTIYDCDFNLALGCAANLERPYIFDSDWNSFCNRSIVTGEHCFGCTAGSGSSCSGS